MDVEDLIAADVILLLLAAPTRWKKAENRVNGITRLEKLLFLVKEECDHEDAVEEFFDFVPYDYGPYSREVYEAVDLLKQAGLVSEQRELVDSPLDCAEDLLYSDMTTEIYYERRFMLTRNGETVAEFLAGQHPEFQKQISRLKDKYAGLSLSDLIFDVYTRYPASAERSVIRDKVAKRGTARRGI